MSDPTLDALQAALEAALGPKITTLVRDHGELTITVPAADYLAAAQILRDEPSLAFEQMMDLAGLDPQQLEGPGARGPALRRRLAPAVHRQELARAAESGLP
jgi:NADH-quinone oxidoreductase subunit C